MGLNNFVANNLRPLPIFILADTSASMSGEKINELNLALREMVNSLNATEDLRGKFQVSVITFGQEVKVLQELSDIDKLDLKEFSAAGNTPMGEAFTLLHSLIEDREVVSPKSYTPTIVLISDGCPTDCETSYDKWEPLIALHTSSRCAKCQRIALGIGADADINMLKSFINNDAIPLIKTQDAKGISKFFKWVTMSTIARMNSINPNDTNFVAPSFDFDSEDIII